MKKYRLDAVIAHYHMITELLAACLKVPEVVGVAGFATFDNATTHPEFTTYAIDGTRLGSTAIDFLQTMVQHNQAGIPSPESQHPILIRGSWRDGTTVRSLRLK